MPLLPSPQLGQQLSQPRHQASPQRCLHLAELVQVLSKVVTVLSDIMTDVAKPGRSFPALLALAATATQLVGTQLLTSSLVGLTNLLIGNRLLGDSLS